MPIRRPMTPADIHRQVVVEELDLSLDGRRLALYPTGQPSVSSERGEASCRAAVR